MSRFRRHAIAPGRLRTAPEAAGSPQVAKRRLEKAGAHGAVRFDDGRDPWGIALDRREVAICRAARRSGEAAGAPASRALGDEAVGEVGSMLSCKGAELGGEEREIVASESATSPTRSPSQPPGRLKASLVTSAARKLMRSSPSSRAAATVARKTGSSRAGRCSGRRRRSREPRRAQRRRPPPGGRRRGGCCE